MRKLLFILLLFVVGLGGSAQDSIDSLKILPQNPDSSDIIKVVCYATFTYSGCNLDSSEIILGPTEVTINACYTTGLSATICNSIDTITIGIFAIGNYVLFYNLNNHCDSIIVSDSLNFTVDVPNNLSEEKKTEPFVNIYPNPTTGIFTVQGATAEIQVYDLFGRLVLRSNKPEIDMSSYPAGLYIWSVGSARGKLIIK